MYKKKYGRKRPFRRIKKRLYKRYRKKAVATVNHPRSLTYKPSGYCPLPQEYTTKVRCRGTGLLTPNSANPVGFNNSPDWVWDGLTLGGVYQPLRDFTTAGITSRSGGSWTTDPVYQCRGFTTLCNSTMYQRYQVLGAKVTFTPMSTSNTEKLDVCMWPIQTGGATPTSFAGALSAPYVKRKVMSQTHSGKGVSMYIDFAKYLGVDKKVFRNDSTILPLSTSGSWSAQFNGTPQQLIGVGLAMECSDLKPFNNVAFEIEIDYYVRLFMLDTAILI